MNKAGIKQMMMVGAILLAAMLILAFWLAAGWMSVREAGAEEVQTELSADDDFEAGKISLVLEGEYSQYRGISPAMMDRLESAGAKSVENLFELPAQYVHADGSLNEQRAPSLAAHYRETPFKQILSVQLQEESKQAVIEAIPLFEQLEGVESAEPVRTLQGSAAVAASSAQTPNDPYYDEQWGLAGNGIDAEGAWERTKGSASIRVGVIDSGVADHEDLNANLLEGYDFYTEDTETNDVAGGHGTHVAGIIAAVGNNGKGISGVAPNVKIVPLQTAYNTSGSGVSDPNDVKEAIEYATARWEDEDSRIHILNCSIDGFGIEQQILAAANNFPGLFVWAAGNKSQNMDALADIAAFQAQNVISVGALAQEGDRYPGEAVNSYTNGSNYGQNSVDIFAPGDDILSTFPAGICESGCLPPFMNGTHFAKGYHRWSGTSMAAPFVTGVAALLLSENPKLQASEVKQIILDSATVGTITVPGNATQTVKKLDAAAALDAVEDFEYTVTFNKTGGSGGSDSVKVAIAEDLPSIAIPTRTGYTFSGYYTATSGGGTQYYSSTGQPIRQPYDMMRSITLYARWEPRSWTISVEPDGTMDSLTDITMYYDGDPVTISAAYVPGLQFVEWRKYYNNSSGYTVLGTSATIILHPNDFLPSHFPANTPACYVIAVFRDVRTGMLICIAERSNIFESPSTPDASAQA